VRRYSFQKVLYLSIIFIFISLILQINSAFSWTEPIRLTNHLDMVDPLAVNNGRNLYLISWSPTGEDFHFLSSCNNGFSWGNPIQPADTFYGGSNTPDIECTPDGLIHVVWVGLPFPNAQPQIYHQSSLDGGRHWSNRHQVFRGSEYYLYYPRLASKEDTLLLACRNLESILVFRSFDSGLTWHDSTVVGISENMDYPPTILYSQGRLHLIYELNANQDSAGYKIYYSQSNDLGLTWSDRTPLSSLEIGPPNYHSQFPSAYADEEGHIVAAWFDYQYGSMCGTTGDILGRVSTDNGDSWLPETRLTYTHSGASSSCLIVDDSIYVAWSDTWLYGCDNPKIVLASSSNWGLSWSTPEVITGTNHIIESAPSLISSLQGTDRLLHCFYDVYIPSYSSDIFYVRNKPFLTDRLPLPINQEEVFKVKAYQDILERKINITFENPSGGEVELSIYNINGQKVWNGDAWGKEGNVIWDASGYSSGVYFARVVGGEASKSIKFILLK
jgi:hypothetical protein